MPPMPWAGLGVSLVIRVRNSWKGDVLAEERPGGLGVKAVDDIGGAADRIAGDGDGRHDVGGAEEVRAARVAVAGAAVAGGRVPGDPQPAFVDRVQGARGAH